MGQTLRSFSERHTRPGAFVCWCLISLCLSASAPAATRIELYQATTAVAGRCEGSDGAAFQAAMKTVLVRVTGRHSAAEDPALAPLVSNARRYVQQCRNTADNQIWVAFDGAAIERWLTQNSQPLWGRERPITLILVAVQSGASNGSVLTADDTSDLKLAIDADASARGLPLLWPSAGDLQKNHLDYAALSAGPAASIGETGRHMGGEGVLIGHANGNSASASVRWTHLFQDRSSEYSGTLEGINRTADLYAGLFAASGTVVPVEIEVVGIADLRDYANVSTYLESLTFISHVGVESLNGDTVRFRLATRGGADSLQRALSLSGKLQPLSGGENGIQRFQLHH